MITNAMSSINREEKKGSMRLTYRSAVKHSKCGNTRNGELSPGLNCFRIYFAHVVINMDVGYHPTSKSVMSMILVEGTDLEQAVYH